MLNWEQVLFLLHGTHKEFAEIEKNDQAPSGDEIKNISVKLKTGDLILRRIDGCEVFYHVGLFADKNVIEFTGNKNSSQCPKSDMIIFICNISRYSRVQRITKNVHFL